MKLTQLSILFASLIATSTFAQQYPNQYPVQPYSQEPYMRQQVLPATGYVTPQSTLSFTDYGTIIRVTPEYEQMNQPRQVCHEEIISEQVAPQSQGHNYGGTALGGIAGGLLGNQIGGGNGRTAATALGAVAGALVGDNAGNNNYPQQPQYQQHSVQKCNNVDNYNQTLTGYRVEYRYHNQVNSVVTQNRPVGTRIKLHLQVTPEVN